MRKKWINMLLLATVVVIAGCSSGRKALDRGDYYEAVAKAINRLKSDPNNRKALSTIKEAYPMAVDYYQQRVDETLTTGGQFKWSGVVGYLETVNRMAEEINRCPAAKRLFSNPQKYLSELEKARNNAAEEQYSAGVAALVAGDRESARQAYYFFEKSNAFVRGYKDVVQKMNEAIELATINVIVEPVLVHSQRYQLSADFFTDRVMDYLYSKERKYKFVQFFSAGDAVKKGLKYPDHVVKMKFLDFSVGNTHLTEKEVEVHSTDSVKVGEVKLANGETQAVYNVVKAKLHTYRREVVSGGLLEMQIVDFQNSEIIMRDQFPGQFVWAWEWGSFNGDERALTKKELAICDRQPIMPPPPQDLFIEFTKPIYDQMTARLNSMYRKY